MYLFDRNFVGCSVIFVGRIDDVFQCLFTVWRYEYGGKHPFDQPRFGNLEFANGQFQQQFVPSFVELNRERGAGNTIFVIQWDFA